MARSNFLLVIVATLGVVTLTGMAVAMGSTVNELADEKPAASAQRILVVVDQILAHHIAPPTRQQLVLDAARITLMEVDHPLPLGLSRRISAAASEDDLRNIFLEIWTSCLEKSPTRAAQIESIVLAGLVASLPGRAHLTASKEHAVNQQLASNRYVGTGIALGMNQEISRPIMMKVFEGGPAHAVGARDGDIIEQIDGKETNDLQLRAVVDLLRGPEGSQVAVTLRQPDEQNPRPYTITRGVVPLKTVVDYQLLTEEASAPIAYARIERIAASTAHEMRQIDTRAHADGAQGLILDLQTFQEADVHHAVLLADALLDGGTIGHVRNEQGRRSYQASPDCVLRDIPLVVLAGRHTSGTTEWLVAALQDNGRASIMGAPTAGQGLAESAVPLPGTDQVLVLATSLLERADGRSLFDASTGRRPLSWIPQRLHPSPAGDDGTPPKSKWSVNPNHPLRAMKRPDVIKRAADLLRSQVTAPTKG